MFDFIVCHYKQSIGTFLTSFVVALSHTTKILPKRSLPYFRCCRIVQHFFVAGDGLTGHWVYHWQSKVFDVWWGVFDTDSNSAVGLKARFSRSRLWHMSALIACCVTICCLAPLGIGLNIFGVTMPGIIPGVLYLVTRLCVCGIIFSTCLAVGLHESMIPGASVIHGMVSIKYGWFVNHPLFCFPSYYRIDRGLSTS